MNIDVLHKELFELMLSFDALCREHNIPYTLHGGSLLGAVREHGFIPWDDDMDTAMTREAFYCLEDILEYNQDFYIYGDIKKQFRRRGNTAVWVDIFVCDYIGTGFARQAKLFALTALDVMNRDKDTIKLSNYANYSKRKQIAFKALYIIGKLFTRQFLVRQYAYIAEFKWLGNRTRMHRSNDQYKGRNEDFPSTWMTEFIDIPFESSCFSVMATYHDMLVKCYGENYMIPIRNSYNTKVHNMVRSIENGDLKI